MAVPALVLLDAATGETIEREGRGLVREDAQSAGPGARNVQEVVDAAVARAGMTAEAMWSALLRPKARR